MHKNVRKHKILIYDIYIYIYIYIYRYYQVGSPVYIAPRLAHLLPAAERVVEVAAEEGEVLFELGLLQPGLPRGLPDGVQFAGRVKRIGFLRGRQPRKFVDDDEAVVGEADAGGDGPIRRGRSYRWPVGAAVEEGVATSVVRESGTVVIGGGAAAAVLIAEEVVVVAALGEVLEDGNEAAAVGAAAAVRRLAGRAGRIILIEEDVAIQVHFHILVVVDERCVLRLLRPSRAGQGQKPCRRSRRNGGGRSNVRP